MKQSLIIVLPIFKVICDTYNSRKNPEIVFLVGKQIVIVRNMLEAVEVSVYNVDIHVLSC